MSGILGGFGCDGGRCSGFGGMKVDKVEKAIRRLNDEGGTNMTYGEAYLYIKNLNTPDPNADIAEKAEAIYKIMTMATLNGVKKADLLRCVRWLWYQHFELDNEQKEPHTDEIWKENLMKHFVRRE